MWSFNLPVFWASSHFASQSDTQVENAAPELEAWSEQVGRAAKRKRTTEDQYTRVGGSPKQHSASQIKHDTQYYFEDGNIILIAEDRAFRVHKGVLSMHSSVFKDLLSLPQPSDANTMDGCPVVRLEDFARHVHLLLEAMYKGAYTALVHYDSPGSEGMSMTTLHDLSWIGDKYAMEPLLDHVYHKLELIFPVDCLADWVSLHEGMQEADVIPNGSERADLLYSIHMIRMWHPRAVNMLPVIFYFYCQLPLQEICLPDTTEPLRLGPEDVERCLQAIPRLFKRKIGLYSTFAVFLSGRVPRICTNEDKDICDRVLALLSNDVMSRDNIAKLPDALEDLEKWCFLRPEWSQLCACCSQEVTHIIWRHRVDTWEILGEVFDIPEWADES